MRFPVVNQTGFQQQLYDKELAFASPLPHNSFIHFLSCITVVSAGTATLQVPPLFRVPLSLILVCHCCNSHYFLFQRLLHTHNTTEVNSSSETRIILTKKETTPDSPVKNWNLRFSASRGWATTLILSGKRVCVVLFWDLEHPVSNHPRCYFPSNSRESQNGGGMRENYGERTVIPRRRGGKSREEQDER